MLRSSFSRSAQLVWPVLILAVITTLTTARAEGPAVQLVEQEYFGSYFKGEVFQRKVKIGNGGAAPLVIQRVNSKCSCARSIGFDASIAPGESGTFELEVDTARIQAGRWGKRISVFTNDVNQPIAVFHFNIEVRELVRTDPAELVVAGPYGEAKELKAQLLAATPTGFSLTKAEANNDSFSVKYEKVGASHYELVLSASSVPALRRDNGFLVLTLESADGRHLIRKLPVAVKHRGYVSVEPDGIVRFQNRTTDALLREGAKPIRRTLVLRSASEKNGFEITSVAVEGADGVFSTEVRTLEAKRAYEVDVIITEYQASTFVQGTLVIGTTVPQSPKIEVKLQAIFGKRRSSSRE